MAELLVVDDHPLFRDGFAHMAASLRPGWALRFADSAAAARAALCQSAPDLLVIDVNLPGEDGFALATETATSWPDIPVTLISGREDAAVRVRARACGARGFVSKAQAPEAIAAALDAVLAGGNLFAACASGTAPGLTPRQAEVLMLVTEGHGNKEIAIGWG